MQKNLKDIKIIQNYAKVLKNYQKSGGEKSNFLSLSRFRRLELDKRPLKFLTILKQEGNMKFTGNNQKSAQILLGMYR